MKVQAVVFDIGRVLIHWEPERFYDRAIGPDRAAAMFAAIDIHGMNESIDKGAPFRETVYAFADANPDWTAEIRFWHDRWIEMASPAIDRSVRLLRALRRKDMPVFALSNFGIGSFDVAASHYPFLEEFDRAFISGHMGVMKPDPAIYAAVETDSGIAPSGLLFTDDNPANTAAAAARGWQTHLFEGPEGWAERLCTEGLLTPKEAA